MPRKGCIALMIHLNQTKGLNQAFIAIKICAINQTKITR